MSESVLAAQAPQPTFSIRHATRADFATIGRHYTAVQDVHAAALPDTFRPMGEEEFTVERFEGYLGDNCLLLIAEEGGEPVGSLLASCSAVQPSVAYRPGRSALIWYVMTEPRMRGRGIARALIGAMAEWAADQGADRIDLSVWHFNADALALYSKLGFAPTYTGMTIAPDQALVRWGGGRLPKRPAEPRKGSILAWLFGR